MLSLNKNSYKKNSIFFYFFFFVFVILFILNVVIINRSYETKKPDSSAFKRLEFLKEKLQKGMSLEKNEFREFCIYSNLLDNIIFEECLCDGKDSWKADNLGINWVLPPDIDELLQIEGFYETNEFYHEQNTSKRRYIRHKNFPEILIGYDEYHINKNGERIPAHYHRYKSSEKKGRKKYLDECGKEIEKWHDHSHIFIDTLKIKKIKKIGDLYPKWSKQ